MPKKSRPPFAVAVQDLARSYGVDIVLALIAYGEHYNIITEINDPERIKKMLYAMADGMEMIPLDPVTGLQEGHPFDPSRIH